MVHYESYSCSQVVGRTEEDLDHMRVEPLVGWGGECGRERVEARSLVNEESQDPMADWWKEKKEGRDVRTLRCQRKVIVFPTDTSQGSNIEWATTIFPEQDTFKTKASKVPGKPRQVRSSFHFTQLDSNYQHAKIKTFLKLWNSRHRNAQKISKRKKEIDLAL